MRNVSFSEITERDSRFSFAEVLRGVSVLLIVGTWILSRTALAGSWEYQAPYAAPNVGGVSSGGFAAANGPASQLFRSNPPVYQFTPYVPPQQPEESGFSKALPFIMAGMAILPALFSDTNKTAQKSSDSPKSASTYQLAKDNPNGRTIKRGPAAIPLRSRYVQANTGYFAAGRR